VDGTITAELRVAIEDGVATITLDRPAQYNALTATMLEALTKAFVDLERNKDVHAIVLTGEGKGFCSGQSLDDPALAGDGGKIDIMRTVEARYNPLLRKMLSIEKPIVAAINGPVAGAGMGIALACDLRLASETASFSTAFVRIGLVPDSGLSFLLPRIIGYARAMEAILLSEKITAQRAYEIGLVNRVCAPENLLAETGQLAGSLARGPRALGLAKRELVHNTFVARSVDEALKYEAEMQAIAGASADFAEGLAAFREKRASNFSGT
jgi:2-(1,2-epoxy-1,2-dihydrophenyl)acetyl-CoA isomerase